MAQTDLHVAFYLVDNSNIPSCRLSLRTDYEVVNYRAWRKETAFRDYWDPRGDREFISSVPCGTLESKVVGKIEEIIYAPLKADVVGDEYRWVMDRLRLVEGSGLVRMEFGYQSTVTEMYAGLTGITGFEAMYNYLR